MPVSTTCAYAAPFWLPGGHAQTIAPRVLQRGPQLEYHRERLELADGDFVDIDWLYASGTPQRRAARVAVLSHGLEGDSKRSYMRCLGKCLRDAGWDVAARNFRGCSGESNRLVPFYHSGETGDLHAVVTHCTGKGYERVALVGFSAGGNQVLRYLGEDPDKVPPAVMAGVGISVPCDLAGSACVLARQENRLYMYYFMRTLRRKIQEKSAMFPGALDVQGLKDVDTFKEFDSRFTAPLYGFASADDYWQKASSAPVLGNIRVPALLINARNDPFLSPSCFPMRVATKSTVLTLLIPREGGHVGFPSRMGGHDEWLCRETLGFIQTSAGGIATQG